MELKTKERRQIPIEMHSHWASNAYILVACTMLICKKAFFLPRQVRTDKRFHNVPRCLMTFFIT